MINLLPPEEKQILLETRQWKTVLILGFIIFIFLVSLALIFASINISISSKVSAQKVILAVKEKDLKADDIQGLEGKITQINQSLKELDSFYRESPSFTGFLDKISDLLPGGISLKNISINPITKENNSFQISLSGYASSVEDVILLKENLKKEESISQVYFPQDVWLQKQDFIFNASFRAVIKK